MERQEITIAGQTFLVTPQYEDGDTINANEAAALNQTLFENLRNNFASKVKEGIAAGLDHAVLQQQLDTYEEAYSFGVRSGGGGRRDPVRTEAIAIALDMVKNKLRETGRKLADYSAKQLTDLAKQVVDSGKYPQIMEQAKDRVEQAKAAAAEVASDLDNLIGGLVPAEPKSAAA